jgi:hypothetical protein
MKVIMLSGKASCGKTTTIHEVYKSLTGNYHKNWQLKQDFEDIVTYQGKTIAFQSEGDFSCDVIEAMVKYDGKCDILICACNTRFVRPYQRINNYPHVIVNKTVSPDKTIASCAQANAADVQIIISHI